MWCNLLSFFPYFFAKAGGDGPLGRACPVGRGTFSTRGGFGAQSGEGVQNLGLICIIAIAKPLKGYLFLLYIKLLISI